MRMGVRIDNVIAAAPAKSRTAAGKPNGQPAGGEAEPAQFQDALAKAQPRNASRPAEASSQVEKAPGKKQVKAAGKKESPEAEVVGEGQQPVAVDKVERPEGAVGVGTADTSSDVAQVGTPSFVPAEGGTTEDADVAMEEVAALLTQSVPPPQAAVTEPGEGMEEEQADVRAVEADAPDRPVVPMAELPAAGVENELAENSAPVDQPPRVTGVGREPSSPASGEGGDGRPAAEAASQRAKPAQGVAETNAGFAQSIEEAAAKPMEPVHETPSHGPAEGDTGVQPAALTSSQPAPKVSQAVGPQPASPPPPEVRFAEANHPTIVSSVKSELLPNGGSMLLRLDPPDLGPMRLVVRMEDGMMSASFETSNARATGLLSHTLGELKQALESAGVGIDRLQVKQGSADRFSDGADPQQRQPSSHDEQPSARHEQQRREMLNRMWRKLTGGADPLDILG